jgi:hypothetical protein
VLAWQLVSPAAGFAQAWLPPKGEGSVSLVFTDVTVKNHFDGGGAPVDRGRIRWDTMLLDASYGLTDKVTVSLALPFVAAKYNGSYQHILPNGSTLDTGAYHATFQDLRFDLRYNATKGPLVVTPFVGTLIPSHDYQYMAHSAVGRDLHELQVGAYVARRLDPVLPGGFIQGRYSYGFVEQVLNVSHNRSNLDLELGYFVSPSLRVFGMSSGQVTHGGIFLPGNRFNFLDVYSQTQFYHHDQIAKDDMLSLGGGAGFSVSDSVDLFGSVSHMVAGRNMHQVHIGATFGITYSFKRRPGSSSVEASGEHSLVKCLCQKKTT